MIDQDRHDHVSYSTFTAIPIHDKVLSWIPVLSPSFITYITVRMSNFIQCAKDSNIAFQHGSKKCSGLKSSIGLKQTEDQRDDDDDDDLGDYRSRVWEECDYDTSIYTASSLQVLNQSHSYQMKLLQKLKMLKPKNRVKKKKSTFDKVPLINPSPSSNSSDGWKYLTVEKNKRDGNEDSNTHDF